MQIFLLFLFIDKNIFPEFNMNLIITIFTLLFLLYPLKEVAKILSNHELINVMLFMSKKTMYLINILFIKLSRAIESPIKRPKKEFIWTIISIVYFYVMSVFFLLYFTVTVVLYISIEQPSLYQNILFMFVIYFLLFITLYFRTQVDKEYILAKEQWKSHKNW